MTKKSKIITASAVLVALIAILCVCTVLSVNAFARSDKIIKNTLFCGIDIGGKTEKEAIELIEKNENLPNLNTLTVDYKDKNFSFTPLGAGISYDTENIVKNAVTLGRDKSFFKNLMTHIRHIKSKELETVYIEDKEFFKETIKTLAKDSDIIFNNYTIDLHETYADIQIGKDKKIIDYDKLLDDTYNIMKQKDKERKLTLPVSEIESIDANDIYDDIYVEPRNARAEVKDGKTTVTSHQVGVILDISEIEKGLSSGQDKFRIKIEKKYPQIRDEHLNGELFNEVLGTTKTTYNAGLIGRTKNVTLAAKRINGIILNPGEVFSYNSAVGPRTYSAGFADATIYTNAGLEEGLGGGICQVSSTLYNSVLYADMKVVERRNHTYTVNYVRNGLDATVVYGAIDFKFENNKKNPVKIVAYASGGTLTVSILGKKENNYKVELYTNTLASYNFETREVLVDTMAPGERVVKQNGAMGYKINATKVVKDAQGNIIRNEFLGTSTYSPLVQIVEVGPAKEEASVETNGEPLEENKEKEENTEENKEEIKEENTNEKEDEGHASNEETPSDTDSGKETSEASDEPSLDNDDI